MCDFDKQFQFPFIKTAHEVQYLKGRVAATLIQGDVLGGVRLAFVEIGGAVRFVRPLQRGFNLGNGLPVVIVGGRAPRIDRHPNFPLVVHP